MLVESCHSFNKEKSKGAFYGQFSINLCYISHVPYTDSKGDPRSHTYITRLGLRAPFLLTTYELDTVHLRIMSLFVLVLEPKIKIQLSRKHSNVWAAFSLLPLAFSKFIISYSVLSKGIVRMSC